MLRRVPAEVDPAAAAAGGASAAAALEPQHPRHAERRRRCRLSLNGQVVEATPAGFGPTIEAVAAAHTVAGLAGLADSPLADSPLRNADDIRGQIGAVERGSVSFVKATWAFAGRRRRRRAGAERGRGGLCAAGHGRRSWLWRHRGASRVCQQHTVYAQDIHH
jgi:hypothetical protein